MAVLCVLALTLAGLQDQGLLGQVDTRLHRGLTPVACCPGMQSSLWLAS